MAQSVKRPTLDFSSGHDLMVCKFEPLIGLAAIRAGTALDPLSPYTVNNFVKQSEKSDLSVS